MDLKARKIRMASSIFLLSLCLAFSPGYACTIFVLTDAQRTLFFNNEDWSNPATRIWFIPAGEGYYGAAYVGFDDGWAQGGVNAEGLAFDWVAGFDAQWETGPALQSVRGNPSQRMLESCATVEEAIAFYRKHWEPGFSYAKIMIADKRGASVIIGAKNGQLQFDRSHESRGFGYGSRILHEMLVNQPIPTLASGASILQACLQEGQYATKYSSVYDLKSGNISLLKFSDRTEEVQLNLHDELKKGAHYYDIPAIGQQLKEAPMMLQSSMKRFPLDAYKPIPDQYPAITQKISAMLTNAMAGGLRSDDFSDAFWKVIAPMQQDIQADLTRLGRLISLTPVEAGEENPKGIYRYRIEYENAIVLQTFVLDDQHKITFIKPEGAEQKFDARKKAE